MKPEIYELITKLGLERKIRAAALVLDGTRDEKLRQIFDEYSTEVNMRWGIASEAAELLPEPERSEKLFSLLQQIIRDNFDGATVIAKMIIGQLQKDSFEIILSVLVLDGNFISSREYAEKIGRELTMDELEIILRVLIEKQTYGYANPVADEIMTRIEKERRQANEEKPE